MAQKHQTAVQQLEFQSFVTLETWQARDVFINAPGYFGLAPTYWTATLSTTH